ncbi:hypothetical protein [Streptomyces sp. NBC_00096]|uniref:hypothetical protein n=1 Tax=Streptomyces sp. NBC_00096 TaxID=2975650 RepID=UPI00324E1FB2
MEMVKDAYRQVTTDLEQFDKLFLDVASLAYAPYYESQGSPWAGLLVDSHQIYTKHRMTIELTNAIGSFTQVQGQTQAKNLCVEVTKFLKGFTKEFTENCICEREDAWKKIGQYYANSENGTSTALREDLTKAYEAFQKMLESMASIARSMEYWKDFIRCDDLPELGAEMAYWQQYAGQWFSYAWSHIPVDEAPPPTPRGGGGGQGRVADVEVRGAGIKPAGNQQAHTASQGQGQGQGQPAGSTPPATQAASSSFSPGATNRPRPLIPAFQPARSRKPKRRDNSIPVIGRLLFTRESTKLKDADAAAIADAIKFNVIIMRLLMRRMRKEILSDRGCLGTFQNHIEQKDWTKSEYLGLENQRSEFTRLLNVAESEIDEFKRYEEIIRSDKNTGALQPTSDAANKCYATLQELAKYINEHISKSISPMPASRLIRRDKNRLLTGPGGWELIKDLEEISKQSRIANIKCEKLVERTNKIITDNDFEHKYMPYQGILRITGYPAAAEAITPKCINRAQDKATKVAAQSRDLRTQLASADWTGR